MRTSSRMSVVGSALLGTGLGLLVLAPSGAQAARGDLAAALPPSASASALASTTATPSVSASASTTGTPSVSASASTTATATPSVSASTTATPDPSATASASASATASPSPSPTCPPASSSSASADPSGTASVAPSASVSASASPSTASSSPGILPSLLPRAVPVAAAQEPARDETSCRATSVSLSANVRLITAGNAPTLSGVVRDKFGDAISGATVTIYAKPYATTSYTAIATVQTDSAGQYRMMVRPTKQTAYGANVGDARSPILVIQVHTRVNITRPAPGTVSSPVVFEGGLVPGYANVAVGLGTLVNGRFSVLAQSQTTSTGGYAITAALPAGTATYIVFTSAHRGTLRGSKSVRLTVR